MAESKNNKPEKDTKVVNLTLSQIEGLSIIAANERGVTLYLKNIGMTILAPEKLAKTFNAKKIFATIKQTDIGFEMMMGKKFIWDKKIVAYVTRDKKSGKIITYINEEAKNKTSKKQKMIKFSRLGDCITTEVVPYSKKGKKVVLRELHRLERFNVGETLKVLT